MAINENTFKISDDVLQSTLKAGSFVFNIDDCVL